MLTILPAIHGHFVIWFLYIWQPFIYCMMKTNLCWKLLYLQEDWTKNNLQLWPYIRTCWTFCHPDLIYGPALISSRGNVPPWLYILAHPSIWHLRVTPDRPWSILIITWLNIFVSNAFMIKYIQNHHQIQQCHLIASTVTSSISP